MTSKRKQIKKIPIYIFFSKYQIPEDFRNVKFEEYNSHSVFKSDEKVFVNLSKLSNLNTLQKNYKLLFIGMAIRDYCKSGNFFVEYFGSSKIDIKIFFLGWALANYTFDKYKSKKKIKHTAKIS